MSKDQRQDKILEQLQSLYPGMVAVTPGTALVAAGLASDKNPEQTARQAIARHSFPFPVVLMGSRKRVLLTDVASVLATAVVREPAPPANHRRAQRAPAAAAGASASMIEDASA